MKVLLITDRRTYRGDQPWTLLREEIVEAHITPKRIKARKMTFDRATGQEITSYRLGSYRHSVKELPEGSQEQA
jgi:hypothetical protein